MRPLALRIENLTAFRGVHGPLSFDGLDLFAIAGPTGAGKSSLLDAMLLALYGEVPRTGNQLKELISLGKDQLSVSLDFVRGGEAYRVTRRLYRNTRPTQAQLERLGRSGVGGQVALAPEPEALAEGVKDVNAAIQRLLGLDLNAFTQAVILPQGEFARFLKSTAKDRQKILGTLLQLLVYERMRDRAQTESRAAEAAASTLERTLGEDAAVTPEAVAALKAALAARVEANALLEPRLERATAEAAAGEERVRVLREQEEAKRTQGELELRRLEVKTDEARLSAARRAQGVVPLLDQAEAAAREAKRLATEAERARDTAARAKATADERRAAHERVLADAARLPGLDAQIEALGQAVVLAGPLADALRAARAAEALAAEKKQAVARGRKDKTAKVEAAAEAERVAQEATAEAERAAVGLVAAESALAAAEAARREAEKRDAVAHLRHGLQKGDACPVCERALTKAPPAAEGNDLPALSAAVEQAHQARDAARAAAERARQAAEQKRTALERAALAAEAATREVERASAEALEADERAIESKAAHEARASELAALVTRALAGLPEAQDAADPAALQARLRKDRLRLTEARDAAQAALAAAETALAGAEATASAAAQSVGTAEQAALAHAATAREAVEGAQFASAEAARQAALAPAEQQRLEAAIQAWSSKLSLAHERVAALAEQIAALPPGPRSLAEAQAALAAAQRERDGLRTERENGLREAARLEEQAAAAEKRLEQVAKRRAELDLKRAKLSLLKQLAEDLKVNRFQAYLLEETLAELVQGASQRLLALSSGRYALSYADDDFHVQDNDNAGERRRADTLSGGETFLASLALALELSQQVQKAAGAIHLESLFIDEGFGTLDPETLETVQEAIESLPTGGRMVGVITHLAELTARLPARIVVEKGPAGSSFKVEVA
ncbi:MAG: SMC family ATPase [Vicinamibacteria bacterium]|nr:SMC family ATPase [Vicinamibacteria bacterium]